MSEIYTLTSEDLETVSRAEGGNNDHYFVKPLDEYERDFSLMSDYNEIIDSTLARSLGISDELATELRKEIVEEAFESGKAHMPDLYFWEKDVKTQDRDLNVLPLDKYIESAIEDNLRLTPTMTCYWTEQSPGVDRKIIPYESNWVRNNVQVRAKIKKEGLAALARRDFDRYEQLNPFQLAKKRGNNTLSGLESLKYLPIYTMSGHNSLTGPTRIITSLGNLTLERAVGGNRYYRNINEMIMEWELSIKKIDLNAIENTCREFNLVYPTPSDLYDIAYIGGQWQFNVRNNRDKIIQYASSLSPLERAAVAYNLDMFNLYKLNNDVIGTMIYDSSQQRNDITNDLSIITEGRLKNAVHHILIDKLAGKDIDYKEIAKKDNNLAKYIASTYVNLCRVIDKYSNLLDTFFKDSKMFATHISDSKRIIKRVIKLSDTDSTCDSKFYFAREGNTTKYKYTKEGIAKASVVTFIISGVIDGQLKQFSKNMGVDTDKLGVLSVKPEVTWSVFTPSKAAKHYTNAAILVEYIALLETEYSSSGVGLIAGAMSPKFKKFFESMKEAYLKAVDDGVDINAKDLDVFNQQLYNILFRETIISPETMLKSARIKQPHLYSQEASRSNYSGLWCYQYVFGSSYAEGQQAPTPIRSIPLSTSDKKKMDKFLQSLLDSGEEQSITIANNFKKWLKETGRTHITTIKVPTDVADIAGWVIPKELIPILDKKRLIKGVYNTFTYFGKTAGAVGSGGKYKMTTTDRTLGLQDRVLPKELNVIDNDETIIVPFRGQKKLI